MKSKGAKFCISVYHHIRQLVVQEFFLTRSGFPVKQQKIAFYFVFTLLPKHIKSLLKCKSVCGRVVKPSSLSTALSSYNCSITGSSLDSARFTHHFLSIILH